MKNQLPTKIMVRCSYPVALEMCRYDGSRIVQEELIESSFDSMVDNDVKRHPELYPTPESILHEKDQHRIYRFTILGHRHTVARWNSFGVMVHPVE